MQKRSRILIIALPMVACLLGAVIYDYGYLSVQSELSGVKEEVNSKGKMLAKYRALIAQKPVLEKRLTAITETRKTDNAKMIDGQTLSLAAASLQSSVKIMITSRGGSISSERDEKPETNGKFKLVTVTLDAVLPDTRALADTLYAIETQTPYLIVREVDTRIRNFKEPRDLTVRLKISGLTEGR